MSAAGQHVWSDSVEITPTGVHVCLGEGYVIERVSVGRPGTSGLGSFTFDDRRESHEVNMKGA